MLAGSIFVPGESRIENGTFTIINVGVAEWRTARKKEVLRTTLGSCVGIVLYSPEHRVGGLAHILLADPPPGRIVHRGKYARTAVPALLTDLRVLGVQPSDLKAMLFGGATVLNIAESHHFHRIGVNNIEAARSALQAEGISIQLEETGGTTGRTISFFATEGRIDLRVGKTSEFASISF